MSKYIADLKALDDTRASSSGDRDLSLLHYMARFKHSWSIVQHDKLFAFLSMDLAVECTSRIPIDYEMPLSELLVHVYEARCVETAPLVGAGTPWRRQLSIPEDLLVSLKLQSAERTNLLKLLTDKIMGADDDIVKQRWQHIYNQLEFAAHKLGVLESRGDTSARGSVRAAVEK